MGYIRQEQLPRLKEYTYSGEWPQREIGGRPDRVPSMEITNEHDH